MVDLKNDHPVSILALHGFSFKGVLQTIRQGDMGSVALRLDCPVGKDLICLRRPDLCPFLQGFRRNKAKKTFVVLCHLSQQKEKTE